MDNIISDTSSIDIGQQLLALRAKETYRPRIDSNEYDVQSYLNDYSAKTVKEDEEEDQICELQKKPIGKSGFSNLSKIDIEEDKISEVETFSTNSTANVGSLKYNASDSQFDSLSS